MYAFLMSMILSVAWTTNALATEAPSYSSIKEAFSAATDPLSLEVIAEFDTVKTNGPKTKQNRWSDCHIYFQEGGEKSFILDFVAPSPNGIGFGDILVLDGRLYHGTQFSGGFAETGYREGLPIHFPNQQSIVIERPQVCEGEGCTLSWEFRATDSKLYFYERAQRKSDDGSADFLNENYGFCQLI